MFPIGTVTFLFTDLEGSTQLWERYPEAMQAALARHDAILRAAVEAHGGVIVKMLGDGLHAAFASALDGVGAALAAQQALAAEVWGETGPLRVRMGLHTGEAELRAGDYYGPALNRAARLMAAGWGGQVLLSSTTAELVKEKITLRDLGSHRLKDLVRPETIYQWVAADLPADFPPPRTLSTIANNLPVQLTSFVGREKEMDEVKALLARARLITLIGPGGTGKTRLSLQGAADIFEQFAEGVWFIELAPLADPALMVQAVAATLQVREVQGQPLLNLVVDYLRSKQSLLILDNCEHLVEAAAHLADTLLQACPKLKILASSREALGIAGESIYRVPSLSLPEATPQTPTALAQCEAARLFVDRATAAQNRFSLTENNVGAVAQICRRLDGIPLAIELAAARVKVFSVEQIGARLDDRFKLLTGGSRTALPRQQTLRALIDWSYDLLSEEEQAALRQISVFAGGWTFEAAEAMLGPEALDLLTRLIDKSLVVVEEQVGAARYRLLETIRQYARDKLLEAGEAVDVRTRHLDYFLTWARIQSQRLEGAEMMQALDALELELDNLRAAMEWAMDQRPLAALELPGLLNIFWGRRASVREGLHWLRTSMAKTDVLAAAGQVDADAWRRLKAEALFGITTLLFGDGENRLAAETAEAGLVVARELKAKETLSRLLGMAGLANGLIGRFDRAWDYSLEAINLARELNYAYGLAMAFSPMGMLAVFSNNPLAMQYTKESIDFARRAQNPWLIALGTHNAARLATIDPSQYEQAIALFEEATAVYIYMRDERFYAACRSDLAHLLRKMKRYDEARAIYSETIKLWQGFGNRGASAHELECFGFLALAEGRPERAAHLLGAAEALRAESQSNMTPNESAEYDGVLAQLRDQVSEPDLMKAWQAGRGLTMEEVIKLALEH